MINLGQKLELEQLGYYLEFPQSRIRFYLGVCNLYWIRVG